MNDDMLKLMTKSEFNDALLKNKKIFTKYEFKEDIRQDFVDTAVPFIYSVTTKSDPISVFTIPERLVFINCRFNFPFSYTFLNNITFIKCMFDNFEMNNMSICNTHFTDCVIIEKDMRDSIFVKTSFNAIVFGCILSKTLLSNSEFSDVVFGGANLEHVDFLNCSFEYSQFINCDLDRSNFTFSEFENTLISGGTMRATNLMGAKLDNLPLNLNSKDINGGQNLFDLVIATLSRFKSDGLRPDQVRLINTFWEMGLASGDHLKIEEMAYPTKPKTVFKQKLNMGKINLDKFEVYNGEVYLKGEPIKVKNVLKALKFMLDAYENNEEDETEKRSNVFELMGNLLSVLEDHYTPIDGETKFKNFVSSLFESETEDNLKVLSNLEYDEINQIIRTKTSEIEISDIAWAMEDDKNILSCMGDELTRDEEDAIKRLITLLIVNIPKLM